MAGRVYGNTLFLGVLSMALVLLNACPGPPDPPDPPDTEGPVTQANLDKFTGRLDTTLDHALDTLLPSLLKKEKQLKFAPRSVDTADIPGVHGVVSARGIALDQREPARYEVSLVFDDYAGESGDAALMIDGAVEYNFVVDTTSGQPVLHGIYRGSLMLGGSFEGAVELEAVVRNGARAGLRLNTGEAELADGEAPPSFITYVSTLAGTGDDGHVDGPGDTAQFHSPHGVAVAENGEIFVADYENDMIRKIALDGTVSTVIGGLLSPDDVAIESESTIIVSQWLNDEAPISRVSVAGPNEGELIPIVAEQGYSGSFPLCGIIGTCDGRTPIATVPYARNIDVQDNIIFVAQGDTPPSLRAILPDGYAITLVETSGLCGTLGVVGGTVGIARGTDGETYFVNNNPGCYGVYVLDPDGEIRLLAGDIDTFGTADGIGEAAQFFFPSALAYDDQRYLYVADSGNSLIRRVNVTTGEVERVVGCLSHTEGFDCNNQDGFRDGPGDYAQFDDPSGIDIDRWGDLYVGDARNHAVRLIRIIADPGRTPVIDDFDPAVVRRGEETKLVIHGRNLALTNDIDLGPGITVTLGETGYLRMEARISIDESAESGPRTLTVTTDYGETSTPEDMALTVLKDDANGPFVETIAGTGEPIPDALNFGPADNTTFSFAGGLHAISADRVLVADPLENRIRLVTTKTGAVEEIIQLLTYSATGQDLDILGTTLTALEGVGDALEFFGISDAWTNNAQDEIRNVAEQAVDSVCDSLDSDCEWLSLPWAGIPFVAGKENGFRLTATFWVPTDIWIAGSGRYYISDAANEIVRVVGYDPEKDEDKPNQVFSTSYQPSFPFSVTSLNQSVFTSVPSSTVLSLLSLESDAVDGAWAGVEEFPSCAPAPGGGAQPIGIPLGIAARSAVGGDSSIYVADPFCKTIWRVVNNNGQAEPHDIRSGDIPPSVIGPCVDGPASLATWGAPMDVAVGTNGTIYVADCGCNSIRQIKDYGFGQDLDAVADGLAGFLASHSGSIPVETVNAITQRLATQDTEFLDANRYWVTTVAGSSAGEPGFRDGPAGSSLFDAPTGVTVTPGLAETDERDATVLFVTDTGNRRIRRIVIR